LLGINALTTPIQLSGHMRRLIMMHDWGFGWGLGGGRFFGPLGMITWPLVVVLINWFIDHRDSPKTSIPAARDILNKRFANGEIERDKYEERRKVLDANSLQCQ
jgi:uncharacterized membrane protein